MTGVTFSIFSGPGLEPVQQHLVILQCSYGGKASTGSKPKKSSDTKNFTSVPEFALTFVC